MNASISIIKSIGAFATELLNRAGYHTIGDLSRYNGDDRRFLGIINKMKIERPGYHTSYWRRVCTRCVNIIYRVRNSKALPFVPDHMMCPITHELMTDPVVAPSGISYERFAIEEWLNDNRGTEPSTRALLSSGQLYQNRNLRECIEHYRNNYQIYSI